jgi:hypothetical protein
MLMHISLRIYTDAEGYEPANEVEQAQARERLNRLYGRFEVLTLFKSPW